MKNITSFYEESLIILYSMDPIYNYKNNTDSQKEFLCYNPPLTDENCDTFEPVKSRGKTLRCKTNTIHDTINKPFVLNHLKRIKATIHNQNLQQTHMMKRAIFLTKTQKTKIM